MPSDSRAWDVIASRVTCFDGLRFRACGRSVSLPKAKRKKGETKKKRTKREGEKISENEQQGEAKRRRRHAVHQRIFPGAKPAESSFRSNSVDDERLRAGLTMARMQACAALYFAKSRRRWRRRWWRWRHVMPLRWWRSAARCGEALFLFRDTLCGERASGARPRASRTPASAGVASLFTCFESSCRRLSYLSPSPLCLPSLCAFALARSLPLSLLHGFRVAKRGESTRCNHDTLPFTTARPSRPASGRRA